MDMSIYSQLRWDFVYQRPQHIIGRKAKEYRTFYFEEPMDIDKSTYTDRIDTNYHHYVSEEGVNVIVSLVQKEDMENISLLEKIVKQEHQDFSIEQDIVWYYTPMAYTSFLKPKITIYDCMDQLAAFSRQRLQPAGFFPERARHTNNTAKKRLSIWTKTIRAR